MKPREYLEAILLENREEELHSLFYELMYDEEVCEAYTDVFTDLIHDKIIGRW